MRLMRKRLTRMCPMRMRLAFADNFIIRGPKQKLLSLSQSQYLTLSQFVSILYKNSKKKKLL